MSDSFYSFSEPFNRGIDFYQADAADVTIDISISSSLTISSFQIKLTTIIIEANSAVIANAQRMVHAAANLSVEGTTIIIATERQDASVVISAETLVETTITEIINASVSLSSSGDVSISGTRVLLATAFLSSEADAGASVLMIRQGASQIAVLSNLLVSGTRTAFGAANLSGQVDLFISGKISLATIRINILNSADIKAQALRFSNNITADSSLIRSLLMIDGKPLTNQSRTLDSSAVPIYTENINWSGDSSRYYKNNAAESAAKRTFNINWSFIPNYSSKTVDFRESRNYIKAISMDADTHTLTIINQDEDGTTPYTEENITVFVSNFSENLIRRDLVDDVYYFSCAMTLEEV